MLHYAHQLFSNFAVWCWTGTVQWVYQSFCADKRMMRTVRLNQNSEIVDCKTTTMTRMTVQRSIIAS